LGALFKSVEQNNRLKKCIQSGKSKKSILQGIISKQIITKGKAKLAYFAGDKDLLTLIIIILFMRGTIILGGPKYQNLIVDNDNEQSEYMLMVQFLVYFIIS
jgi:uncharacterized protein (UPF0218 family)